LFKREAEAESKVRSFLTPAIDLKGGNPKIKTLYFIYDSRAPT